MTIEIEGGLIVNERGTVVTCVLNQRSPPGDYRRDYEELDPVPDGDAEAVADKDRDG